LIIALKLPYLLVDLLPYLLMARETIRRL